MKPEEEKNITSELDAIDSPLSPPPEHIVIKAKKERHIIRNLFITLFALAFLAAAGYVGWLLVRPLEPGKENAPQTTTPSTPAITAAALVAEIKPDMIGEATETVPNGSGTPAPAFSLPVYQPKNFEFSVRPSEGSGFSSYGAQSTITADLRTIETALKDKGLTQTVLDPGSDVGMYAADFQSDDVICLITDQKPASFTQRFITSIGCADKESYVASAKALQPYFDVYKAESGNATGDLLLGNPTVKVSATAGYTTTTIGISGADYGSFGGFGALFYTTPDKKIHFFLGTQNVVGCDRYNTPDLKKAYLGESCYEQNNDKAVVKL